MQNTIIIVVGLLVLFILYKVIIKILERKVTMDLMKSIMKDEATFSELLDNFKVKFTIPAFNREFFRLNYYIVHTNDKKIREQLSLMEKMRMSNKQQLSLYQTVFKYYISINKKVDAKNIARKISVFVEENNLDPEIKKQAEMEIKIYLDRDLKAIPYIEEQLLEASDQEKAVRYLEMTYIYKDNQQLDKAKDCMKKVIELTTDENQKKTFEDLLRNNLKDL